LLYSYLNKAVLLVNFIALRAEKTLSQKNT